MAASIEDFARRIVRANRQITFVFTEDFFNVVGMTGINTERFRELRTIMKNVFHRRGQKAESLAKDEAALFDVDAVIVGTDFQCIETSFLELADGPFGAGASIAGYGTELIDAEKAKFQIEAFFSDKKDYRIPVARMLLERKKRQLVLVAEKPGDFKRPSLERVLELRHRLYKILISPEKGPVVDCQVTRLFQEGNSNSFSNLMNKFCTEYK